MFCSTCVCIQRNSTYILYKNRLLSLSLLCTIPAAQSDFFANDDRQPKISFQHKLNQVDYHWYVARDCLTCFLFLSKSSHFYLHCSVPIVSSFSHICRMISSMTATPQFSLQTPMLKIFFLFACVVMSAIAFKSGNFSHV